MIITTCAPLFISAEYTADKFLYENSSSAYVEVLDIVKNRIQRTLSIKSFLKLMRNMLGNRMVESPE